MEAAQNLANLINVCSGIAGTVSLLILAFRVGRRALNAI